MRRSPARCTAGELAASICRTPRGMQSDCVRNGRIGRLALRMPTNVRVTSRAAR